MKTKNVKYEQLEEFWYFAETCVSQSAFGGQRVIRGIQDTDIELPQGGDWCDGGQWECFGVNSALHLPINKTPKLLIHDKAWFLQSNQWKTKIVFSYAICGNRASLLTFDRDRDFDPEEEGELTPANQGNLDTVCDQLFVVFKTENAFYAGSRDRLSFVIGRKDGLDGRVKEVVSIGKFRPNSSYGTSLDSEELPDQFTVRSVKSLLLYTDYSDALHARDVFVFGRNSKSNQVVPFSFWTEIDKAYQISRQKGEGREKLKLPVVRNFDEKNNVFSTEDPIALNSDE